MLLVDCIIIQSKISSPFFFMVVIPGVMLSDMPSVRLTGVHGSLRWLVANPLEWGRFGDDDDRRQSAY